eukprot:1545387-Rhodomonas_salina.1
MAHEHEDGTDWTTGNYDLTTNPKQEFEFVDSPDPKKTYPGEDVKCRQKRGTRPAQRLRRRQDAKEVWRELHAALPVAEALESFKAVVGSPVNFAAFADK